MEPQGLRDIQIEYGGSCVKYEQLTDLKLRNDDIIIISGYGCSLRVKAGALEVFPGRTHKDQTQETMMLYRGVHHTRQVVIIGYKGLITLDAIQWASEQGISILALNALGNLLMALPPESDPNAKLRRAQYQAEDTGLALHIARELVRRKTQGQIETLNSIEKYKKNKSFKQYRLDHIWNKPVEVLERDLLDLSRVDTIKTIMMVEARLAMTYWETFIGIPIMWQSRDAKIVPPHWQTINGRIGSQSGRKDAGHATNPFHAVLNYSYAVLQGMCKQALLAQGFDPVCGFLHADQTGRDSLVFDLMECHHPQVDKLVLDLFVENTLAKGDFMSTPDGSVKFNPQFSRYIAASCRLQQEVIDDSASWLRSCLGA